MDRKPSRKTVVPLVVWDTLWKLVAIRRAIQLRDYTWIAGIAVTSSAGIVPMYYLWRNRGRPHSESVPPVDA